MRKRNRQCRPDKGPEFGLCRVTLVNNSPSETAFPMLPTGMELATFTR